MTSSYDLLKQHCVDTDHLGKAKAFILWDSEVMMPPNATEDRAKVEASLEAAIHAKNTDPRIKGWIADALQTETDPLDQRNLMLIAENYALANALPEPLVRELAETRSICQDQWQRAKKTDDWTFVEPCLQKLIDLTLQKADIYGQVLQKTPYDACLHMNARGNNTAYIDHLFLELRQALPPLLADIAEKQKGIESHDLNIPIDGQRRLTRRVIQAVGFSFESGRLDESAHPFSGGTKYDARITTRFLADNSLSGFMKGLHETGHALYTQNAPDLWDGLPLGTVDTDMILHESQSLLLEKQVGYSPAFIQYLYQAMQQEGLTTAQTPADILSHLHRVRPDFIRIDANEVTYPLHIITRYDLEKDIFAGNIKAADIPSAWNQSVKQNLGLDVPTNSVGCLQDIHWFGGLFGYFPTYTQGAMAAAQIFHTIQQAIPDVTEHIAAGEFKPLMTWLKDNIHSQGQMYDGPELIKRATGEELNSAYFLNHLHDRYAPQ